MSDDRRIKLCKEVNGKRLMWRFPQCEPEQFMEVLVLALVEKDLISIKPYGYSTMEIESMLKAGGWGIDSIANLDVSRPDFCVATLYSNVTTLEKVAALKEYAVTDFIEIVGHTCGNNYPVCPY